MPRRFKSDRYTYLRQLVSEITNISASESAKEEVLANLANFAYDPQNYDHFKQLNIIYLFLAHLDDPNENLVEFAIGGLCNLILEKSFNASLLENDVIAKVIKCLLSSREETVLSAITSLLFLVTPQSKTEITKPHVIRTMLQHAKSSNKRLSNLANIFLLDYCTTEQIELAQPGCLQEDFLAESITSGT